MSEEKSAYRQVFKATSLFGGVQVFQILISLVRSKVIAVLLGPFGMGIAALLNATINVISSFTNFGLEISAVKDVSEAKAGHNETKIAHTIAVVRRLVWITGLLGMLLTIVLSPWLSQFTFETDDYTWWFVWVSVALLFKQLTAANMVILQGLRKLKHLAKANVLGSFIGLLITVPLYYYFGIDAIVPAIIITFLLSYLWSRYFAQKAKITPFKTTTKTAFVEGKAMIRLGVMLSISGLLVVVSNYVLQIFIRYIGGEAQVGLYAAGFVIINTYVGMVFKAMATDYYPRLAAVANDIIKVRETVLHQAYIAVLIITPIIILFLIFAEFIIQLLYSSKFLPIVGFLVWAIMSTLFKAVSFSMGYIFIAKGDSKIFMKTSVLFNILLLSSSMFGYYLGGLTGLGIGFLSYYILHFILVSTITKLTYNFYFPTTFYLLFIGCIVMVGTAFGVYQLVDSLLWKYIILALILIIAVGGSFKLLDKKLDFRDSIKNFRK